MMDKLSKKHIDAVIELIRRYRAVNEGAFNKDLDESADDFYDVIINNTQNCDEKDGGCILCESVNKNCNKCIHYTLKNNGCLSHVSFSDLEHAKSIQHAIELCKIRADYLQQLLDDYLLEVKNEL